MAYAAAQDGLNRLNDRQNDRQNDRFPLINRRNIQPSRYTRSLVSEALRVGMIDITLVDDIQMQVRGVLEEHLRQLRHDLAKTSRTMPTSDGGTAFSVNEETARAMLDSIFYSLDTYLLGFHDPMYAINALQGMAEIGRASCRERV